MSSFEPKKLALLRIWQILLKHSDYAHPLTQEVIAEYLEKDYGIVLERKAIGRNIADLKEAGFEIESGRRGNYIVARDFEDSELKLLIDGVLQSKHITASHSKDLIERLCGLSNKYFRSHVKNVYSVSDWSKSENQELFYNIETIDEAITKHCQIEYEYHKYGIDGKLHKSSTHKLSPYQLILHNQRYYIMGCHQNDNNNEHMVFHRLDKIKKMKLLEAPATPIESIKGYENGIDYAKLSSARPYMYSDQPEYIVFTADKDIVDQIVDWFGKNAKMTALPDDENKVRVEVLASPNAMEYWALQYVKRVEIIFPESLRSAIKADLENAIKKYND